MYQKIKTIREEWSENNPRMMIFKMISNFLLFQPNQKLKKMRTKWLKPAVTKNSWKNKPSELFRKRKKKNQKKNWNFNNKIWLTQPRRNKNKNQNQKKSNQKLKKKKRNKKLNQILWWWLEDFS